MRVYDHYNCCTRNNVKGARLSVHSKGRAIDIGSFHLADGGSISVLEHWTDPRYGKHLRKMLRRACGTFTTVLGPNYNAAHRNHFHLDKESRRYGAFCH